MTVAVAGWPALAALGACAAFAFLTWIASVVRRDASIVDGVWSLMILAGAVAYAWAAGMTAESPRALGSLGIACVWAARLSVHIIVRNHGRPEDRRYQAIRARNQPHFEWKSLYLVFGLQAGLAWIVALPLMVAAAAPSPLSALDLIGAALAIAGLVIEALADWQLAQFRSQGAGRVMDSGLWRYSRHPNYFGECCVWWGFWLIALAAGAGWTLISPLLMTVLLLKVSGVALLEQDIAERRPGYAEYVRRTNAFFPGPRRPASGDAPA